MSTDTVKDEASVVDSSATQKHDVGNLDDPENCSYRVNEDHDHNPAEEPRLSGNLAESLQKGIWATQVMNEPILEDAYRNSGRVLLIFSVNMSGSFQGYAKMMSSVGWRRDNVWSQGSGGNYPWGRSFKIKWLRLNNVSFHKTLHLKNPLNDFKPVKISRDCQELPRDIGEALCDLIDKEIDEDGNLQRWPGTDAGCSVSNEGYTGHAPIMSWAGAPLIYPPFPYQQRAEARKVAEVQVDHGLSLFNNWALPNEIISPISSNFSEDEFLEMTYEDYLEAHSRSSKRLRYSVSGASPKKQDSKSKDRVDDLKAESEHERSRKSIHHRAKD
ncbi:Zinc finger CCCH domain-containing protein [Drosera capensis]